MDTINEAGAVRYCKHLHVIRHCLNIQHLHKQHIPIDLPTCQYVSCLPHYP
jgi:hypothetical protein